MTGTPAARLGLTDRGRLARRSEGRRRRLRPGDGPVARHVRRPAPVPGRDPVRPRQRPARDRRRRAHRRAARSSAQARASGLMERPVPSRVERPVSRIVLGRVVPRPRTCRTLYDRFVELGGNAFETARWYPTEPALGRWLAGRADRAELFVITKGCHPAIAGRPAAGQPGGHPHGPDREPRATGARPGRPVPPPPRRRSGPGGRDHDRPGRASGGRPDRGGRRLELDDRETRRGERLGGRRMACRRSTWPARILPWHTPPGRRGTAASWLAIRRPSPGTPPAQLPLRRLVGARPGVLRRGLGRDGPGDRVRSRRPGESTSPRRRRSIRRGNRGRSGAGPVPSAAGSGDGQPGRPGLGPERALPDEGCHRRPDDSRSSMKRPLPPTSGWPRAGPLAGRRRCVLAGVRRRGPAPALRDLTARDRRSNPSATSQEPTVDDDRDPSRPFAERTADGRTRARRGAAGRADTGPRHDRTAPARGPGQADRRRRSTPTTWSSPAPGTAPRSARPSRTRSLLGIDLDPGFDWSKVAS